MRRISILHLIAMLLAIVICLSACSGISQSSPELTNVVLPEPETAPRDQIIGDSSTIIAQDVTLFYPSGDGVSLNAITRTIEVDRDENLVRKTLEALLSTNGNTAFGSSIGASLAGLEYGSGIASVNLSIDAAVNRSDQDYLQICASIANTLFGIPGVEIVNILIGERSSSICALPLGCFEAPIENVAAAAAQISSESERFPNTEMTSISRNALLYFPAQDGKYLLPEVRSLSFSADDYVSGVISALGEGPMLRRCCFPAIPGNLELLSSEPQIRVTDSGERIVELNFTSMLTNYLAFAGVEPWQLYGSVVLSVCSFVPGIDAVRICIDGEFIDECVFPDRSMHFEDALMRRRDFAIFIGSSANLYFANENERLVRVEIPMSQSASSSAVGLLSELISPFNADQNGVISVFPDGVGPEDILGVSVQNHIATVNLSANFYSRCQSLDAQQERLLVYAIVNTLTEIDQIGAVAFRIEGEQFSSLSQHIYLKDAFLPDPGLVQSTTEETSDFQ